MSAPLRGGASVAATIAALLVMLVSTCGCEPYLRLGVRNTYGFPVRIVYHLINVDGKDTRMPLGTVAPRETRHLNGLMEHAGTYELQVEDLNGRVVQTVRLSEWDERGRPVGGWEITVGPKAAAGLAP